MSEDRSDQNVNPASLKELRDVDLVRLLAAGNEDVMEVIFDRYYHMVMGVALRIVRDSGEAQDVVQIVFTDFYKKIKLFDARKGSLKTWLLQYSYGRSINRRESLSSRKFYSQSDLESIDAVKYSATGKVLDFESPEAARLIQQVLATLNERQRAVIEMVCFQGLTLAETAELTGESLGNIQHLYYRGIDRMRMYIWGADECARRETESVGRWSRFRGLRKLAHELKGREVKIVKARAL
jgi:RNA polymerase sigma-70 factor (ECF subfamily)